MQLDDFSFLGGGGDVGGGTDFSLPQMPDLPPLGMFQEGAQTLPGLNPAGTPPPSPPGFFGALGQQAQQNPLAATSLGLTGLGSLLGLGGVVQGLAGGGRPQTIQRSRMGTPSPAESQAVGQYQQAGANPWLQQMLAQLQGGQLPVNPAMMQALTGAYAPLFSQLSQAGLEDLRGRGFTGESLGTGLTPGYNQATQDARNSAAQQVYQMIMGLPQMASGIGAQQAGVQGNLIRLLQGETPQTVTQTGAAPNLLQSAGAFGNVLGGIGGALGGYGAMQNQQAQTGLYNALLRQMAGGNGSLAAGGTQ